MASTEPAVTGLPPTEVDQKIDPSIATAITTGAPEHVADASGTSAAPAYTTAPAVGEASSGPVSAGPEKAAEQPPATTTTTTTIITTTTGPTSPEGSQIATAPTSPVVGGDAAAVAPGTNLTAAALPATGDASTTSAAAVPPTANGSAHPTAVNGTEAAVAGAAGAGAVGAGAAAAQKEKEPEMVMKPKEAKKYTKLLKKEAKNDEQDLAKAIKDAQNLEKPLRKANKAEKKSEKRHQSAVHGEHKASKELNKAKLAFEKADAALKKALDELDIKKKHTTATNEAYENAKKRIDELRNAKIANDKERARRQASITTAV